MKRKLFPRLKRPKAFTLAFFILAFVFFAVGLGTLGTVESTGKAYELKKGTTVVFQLTPAPPEEEGGTSTQSTLKQIYLNVGTPYGKAGGVTRIKMRKTSSSTAANAYYSTTGLGEKMLASIYFDSEANAALDEKNQINEENVIKNANFNWIAPYEIPKDSWSVSTYKYELSVTEGNLLVNEIVFVANDGKVIPATVNREFSTGIDAKAAEALIDSQSVPSVAESSFVRYGAEEIGTLMTISEMRLGSAYSDKDVYHAERTYNALGTDLVAFGVSIFGMSPFGLRFMPFLASFGILLLGFLTVRLLTKNEFAAFIFACLYALCGLSIGLGHLGTPLTIGIFFFTAGLYFTAKFFMRGMKKANARSTVPVALGGLFGAAAICVHSAFLVPVVGLAGLFAAGMVRQQTAKRYHLDKAIAEAEEAENAVAAAENEEEAKAVAEEKTKSAFAVARDYRHRNAIAPAAFFSMLVVGAFLLSLFAVIPAYFTYVKIYDNPAAPALGLFNILWKSFVGGFVGVNEIAATSGAWSLDAVLFRGSGERYAVTAAVVNPVALTACAFGIGYAVAKTVKLILAVKNKKDAGALIKEVRGYAVAAGALALMLITAAFAKDARIFVFGAYVAGFLLAAMALRALAEDFQKTGKIILITGVVLLGVCFALSVPFLFSIPVPEAWCVKLFG